MSAIEGVVAYQGWSLRGVPLYIVALKAYVNQRTNVLRNENIHPLASSVLMQDYIQQTQITLVFLPRQSEQII